jgi:mRNA interferase MazF
MKRGEIYWANIAPRSGSEQTGRRPVIIVTRDSFNETPNWASIVVVPLSTSPNQARRGPTAILIPASEAGLGKTGIALCHQITTLDRAKIARRIGVLSPAMLAQIEDGLRATLSLD